MKEFKKEILGKLIANTSPNILAIIHPKSIL